MISDGDGGGGGGGEGARESESEEFSLLIESTRTSLSEKRKRALRQLTQLKHLTPLCTSFVFTLTLPRNTIS